MKSTLNRMSLLIETVLTDKATLKTGASEWSRLGQAFGKRSREASQEAIDSQHPEG